LLSGDSTAYYYGKIFTKAESQKYFQALFQNIPWKNDEVTIFGKHIITKRKSAWYGDSDYVYIYSNMMKQALPWTRELLGLKQIVENLVDTKFNSCLLNLYHDGNEGLGWHSDNEKSIQENSPIASVSFGAERKFLFKHKQSRKTISIQLEHGSLLLMKDTTQKDWLHCLPKSKTITQARINLTFRQMIPT